MKLLVLFLLFSGNSLFAQNILSLSPMLTHLLHDLELKNVETLELNNADPHHHEWSTKQVKKILAAELLIAPPLELNPGLVSILSKRQKPSLVLKVDNNEERFSRAHFWFYPEVSCSLRQQVANYLKLPSTACPYQARLIPELPFSLIIVSHEALAPIFKHQNIPQIVLQNSVGREQTSVTVKKLEELLKEHKQNKILWIKELPYHGKLSIEKYAKAQDRLLKVNLASEKELFASLNNLIQELRMETPKDASK